MPGAIKRDDTRPLVSGSRFVFESSSDPSQGLTRVPKDVVEPPTQPRLLLRPLYLACLLPLSLSNTTKIAGPSLVTTCTFVTNRNKDGTQDKERTLGKERGPVNMSARTTDPLMRASHTGRGRTSSLHQRLIAKFFSFIFLSGEVKTKIEGKGNMNNNMNWDAVVSTKKQAAEGARTDKNS